MQTRVEQADRVTRHRAMFAPFAGFAVLSVQQWLFFGRDWEQIGVLQLAAWVALAVLALAFLMTGGLWFQSREVRRLANDETTERSRQHAIQGGFVAALLTALIVFVVSQYEPLSAQRAAHIISSLGIGVALLVFGLEESRALD